MTATFIQENTARYLICDARQPLITASQLWDELLLYNLSPEARTELLAEFRRLTARELTFSSDITTLSGGQKVLLMCLLALLSPARNILFMDVMHSLDPANRAALKELIDRHSSLRNIVLKQS